MTIGNRQHDVLLHCEEPLPKDDLAAPLLNYPMGKGQPVSPSAASETQSEGPRKVLLIPWAASFVLICFFWDLGRSSMAFLAPYYTNAETKDAPKVGRVGAAGFLFCVMGPWLGGFSDSFERKVIIAGGFAVMAATTATVAALEYQGNASYELMYLAMPLLSICTVLDTTSRMPLLLDLLADSGQEHYLGSVVAVRVVGYNLARALGGQLVGVAVEMTGVAGSFLIVSMVFMAGFLLSARMPRFPKSGTLGAVHEVVGPESNTWRRLCTRPLISVVGVTVFGCLFYWSCFPQLAGLGEQLGADPAEIGMLASAPFWGGLLVAAILVHCNPKRTGIVYCTGMIGAHVAMIGVSADSYLIVLLSLFTAGAFVGFFSTVQNAMVLAMVPGDLRGRAMGLLTFCIGALPFGMAFIGELAGEIGISRAIRCFAVLGVLAQVLWLTMLPEAWRVERPV
mmetsp:Transcript_97368/g.203254  ORF Transcript_97368/g.203254 Transcript_97368/m.203254 type:complete len:452 (+) Transcript_97368:209-1564(+)